MKLFHQIPQTRRAPELYGDFWFNSEPITLRALEGNPVLLFFWDYTSPQSLRLIPFMNGLCMLYAEYGVVCIGVHSPEFFFGKDIRKVETAVNRQGILFPVLTDNDRLVTDAYRVTTIPSICLIDHKGNIYDTISDIFLPEHIERSMQYLLRQSGFYGELPILLNPEFDEQYRAFEQSTRDLFLGYAHGSLGNPEGYSPELPAEYEDPKIYVNGKFYAHGTWLAGKTSFEYAGEPNEGYLLCAAEGKNIEALIGSNTSTQVKVRIDDATVMEKYCGDDIIINELNESCIIVQEPKLFSVIKNNTSPDRLVKLIPQQTGTIFYMFSFYQFPQSASLYNANENNNAL